MILLALIFVLLFVVFIVGGIVVHMYLYVQGAFKSGGFRRIRVQRLGAASFCQTATVPVSESSADLYYTGKDVSYSSSMSAYARRLLLYSFGFLVSLVALVLLVLGATQF